MLNKYLFSFWTVIAAVVVVTLVACSMSSVVIAKVVAGTHATVSEAATLRAAEALQFGITMAGSGLSVV